MTELTNTIAAVVKMPEATRRANVIVVAGAAQSRQESTGAGKILPPSSPKVVETEAMSATVSRLNDHVESLSRDLHFSIDEGSGRTVITVMDTETKEVIRQIPPEEVIALAQRLREAVDEASKGLLVQGKA